MTIKAEPGIYGEDINRLGEPFGKELTIFNIQDLFKRGRNSLQAKFIKSFGQFKMPMGVEVMSEEIIISNMNNGTVEFCDFDGNINLTIPGSASTGPKRFQDPSVATILLDCRILVADKVGCHIYSGTGEFMKTVKPKGHIPGTKSIYGILPLRCDGGQIVLVLEGENGHKYKYAFYDNKMDRVLKEVNVQFPADRDGKKAIRFSTALGNTILLSDMNKYNQGVWITDLNGNIRKKIGTKGQSEEDGHFVQSSGLCFDNDGNFLAICSRTSRIMAFRKDGQFLCNLQFPEGAIRRPSDLSVNDDGKMAVVSLTGQCFLFDLMPGNPNESWPTRGPQTGAGYGGRGRGGHRGGRGNFRGRGRGGFQARY